MSRINVGIGEIGFGKESDTLVTFSLGSCIGITMYDSEVKIGVLGHIRLYDSIFYKREHKPEGDAIPDELKGSYADTAIPKMINVMEKKGGVPKRIVVKLAGGGFMFKNCSLKDSERESMDIGKKNLDATRIALEKFSITALAEEVGGEIPRTMTFDIQTGQVMIKTAGLQDRFL